MRKTYQCSKCKERKGIEAFYQTLTARQSYCIDCTKLLKKEKRKCPDDWITILCGEGGWLKHYFYID